MVPSFISPGPFLQHIIAVTFMSSNADAEFVTGYWLVVFSGSIWRRNSVNSAKVDTYFITLYDFTGLDKITRWCL